MGTLLLTTLAGMGPPSLAAAQTPAPPAASQNPSPMVEATRAHERLAPEELAGVRRSFVGVAGKAVELFVPDRARTHDVVDLVVHFHGAAWLPQQAVAGLDGHPVAAVVNLGTGSSTADWLLRALGLRRTPVLRWGPRGMQQLSETSAGGFELLGFAGNSAPDHVDHLHAMPELLARTLKR